MISRTGLSGVIPATIKKKRGVDSKISLADFTANIFCRHAVCQERKSTETETIEKDGVFCSLYGIVLGLPLRWVDSFVHAWPRTKFEWMLVYDCNAWKVEARLLQNNDLSMIIIP